ncbi:hypothetical protein G9A89_001908 [Geosiphon pyriformis]|nr:hypothetical protein G9A89_001908 [Geosiphon pyriformis]
MKKTVKVSGSESGFKVVASRKKRKEGALAKGVDNRRVAAEVSGVCSWSSETGDTTEFKSVDMEEECLVEETSFDYGEGGALAGGDYDQTPTSSKVKTKKALGKPLEKINFSKNSDDNSVLSDAPLELPSPMKNLVNVPVKKSFALDIGLDKVAGKSSQEKFVVVRKLFSGINGFGGVSIPSKFSGIIRVMFTFKSNLIKATDKAASAKILVNTNLKKSSGQSDQAVVIKEIPIRTSAEAVRAALSEFGVIRMIKMQLIKLWQKAVVEFEQSDQADLVAAEWSILIRKDAVHVVRADSDKKAWDARNQHRDFVRTVGGKTCIIDCHSVMYARARCAVVCFDSAESLDAAVGITLVLRNTNLRWSCLISVKYAKCEKLGHTSLGCVVGGKFLFSNSLHRVFSDTDKSRLATIYAKRLAPVACPVSFGGLSWAKIACGSSLLSFSSQNVLVNNGSSLEIKLPLLVMMEVDNRFATLEHSLASFTEQISKLAMRLNALGPTVSQSSPGCQPLVTLLSQDQGADVVMSEGLGASTGGGNVAGVMSFDMSSVSKLENSMKCLMKMVLGLSAKVDSIGVCSSMNNPAKQKDIIRWHKKMNNMVFIVIETKLKSKVCPWIADKFDGVRVFTSGLDSGHLDTGVAIVLDVSLAHYVYKVSEVPGQLLSIKLLFKDKLSVSILGLYAGASSAVWFSQAGEINSLIVKAVNESSFTVLGGNFNENDSYKCASFRKCLDLGLANSLVRSPAIKMPTWANSRGVRKMINYVLVSSNLVNAIIHCGAVSVSLAVLRFGCDVGCCPQVKSLFLSGSSLDTVWSALFKIRKTYRSLKMAESRNVEESQIKSAIEKRMESFELNKSHTIQSILECLFCKVILDHLVVDDELILEPGPVRSRVDDIMEGWTRKHRVVPNVSDMWHYQYWPLDYVFDEAFSGVMQPIKFLELFGVVSDLPISKAAGLLALIKTARKILSKILSDRILLAYSTHDILCGDNFSVLKSTTTQTPIFAISLVMEDALEKNRELWLVLQNMRKAYDSVGWEHLERCLVKIKMCGKFIFFFGNIHRNRTNQIITDFGLTDDYSVHDGLNQGEVFSPLLWCIFYDPLLYKVKHQESVCRYKFNFHFISRSGHAESQAGFSTFFAAEAFATTQHILNVVSEFFRINDISINNDKTVAIPINARISNLSLFISGSPISVTKKGKFHWYLGIFLSTDGLSKPSLAKAHSDVRFFSNLVLKKAVSDKQFLYLVLTVLQPIVSYRMQFSFVLVSVCNKWDALIRKDLKLKSGLLLNFPSDTIHHPSFYGLKFFSQCQSESKIASLISFANFCGILGQLFSHRSHNLQVLCWHPIYLLSSSAHICVSVSNNFLSGMVCILLECNLSLGGFLTSSFRFHDGVPMSAILDKSLFLKYLSSLRHYGIAFRKLDPCGLVPEWFGCSVAFLSGVPPFLLALSSVGLADICGFDGFVSVCDRLSQVGTDSLSVYTDGSVKNLGMTGCRAGAAAFFEDIDLGLGVCVQSLMSSTLAELQAVALALECIPVDHSVRLFLDSQAALDACKSEVDLVCPDFHNCCWVKRQHIRNVIHRKNLKVSWHKVKGHSGVLGNDCTDSIADTAALFDWFLSSHVTERFLLAGGGIVSGNSRHFVCDVFCSVCWVRWEVGSSSGFLAGDLCSDVNWLASSKVWHPNLHMTTGFTSRCTANICTYFIKALYCRLPMAIQKRVYDKCYSSVLCLYCGEVEVSDYVFSCVFDDAACCWVLEFYMFSWKVLSGLSLLASSILQLLLACVSDFLVFSTLCKSFVFKEWLQKAVSIFHVPKVAGIKIADFVCSICVAFRSDIWLVCAKHRAYMERNGLILVDGSVPISISGLTSRFSDGVVKLLGVTEAFGIRFGFHKSCSFFSGIGDPVSINIIA